MRGKLLIIRMFNLSFIYYHYPIFTLTRVHSTYKFQWRWGGITGKSVYINNYITLRDGPFITRENILINTFVCKPKLSQIQLIVLPVNTFYIWYRLFSFP